MFLVLQTRPYHPQHRSLSVSVYDMLSTLHGLIGSGLQNYRVLQNLHNTQVQGA